MNLKTVVVVGVTGLGLLKAFDICINTARFCTMGAFVGRMYDENLAPEAKDMVDEICAKYKDAPVKAACCVAAYKYGFENPNNIFNAK